MTTCRSDATIHHCAECGRPEAYGVFRRGPLCPRCAGKPARAGQTAARILRDWTWKDAFAFRAARVLLVSSVEDDGQIVATVETITRGFAWWTTTIFASDFPSIHGRQAHAETIARAANIHANLTAIARHVAVEGKKARPLLSKFENSQDKKTTTAVARVAFFSRHPRTKERPS